MWGFFCVVRFVRNNDLNKSRKSCPLFSFIFAIVVLQNVFLNQIINNKNSTTMAEIYQLPENGSNNSGFGNIPFSIPIGGFGGGFGSSFPKIEELSKQDKEETQENDK